MKVSVIIPAYNEEKTVGEVVKTVSNSGLIHEIIVVSDGSTDATPFVAKAAGAKVIVLKDNLGKGGAMMVGVQECKHDIILFLDADLIGLKADHVQRLIEPVQNGHADMTIGKFENGRIATDLAQFFAPFLSGQRAVKRFILEGINQLDLTRFGVEVALTRYVHEHRLRVKEVLLHDLTHIMKEEKFGLVKGFMARIKMYWEIALFFSRDIKAEKKRRRWVK